MELTDLHNAEGVGYWQPRVASILGSQRTQQSTLKRFASFNAVGVGYWKPMVAPTLGSTKLIKFNPERVPRGLIPNIPVVIIDVMRSQKRTVFVLNVIRL
jgi:hypothetical protein